MKIGMRAVLSALVPMTLVLATSQSAVADSSEMSLKERQAWDGMTKHIEEKAAQASEKCGTKITASFDIPSFKGQDIFRQSPTGACRDAINTVTALCASDIGKASVQKNLTTMTCRRSNDGTKATRSGTAVVILLDPNKTSIVGKEKGSYSWKSALEEIL